VRVKMAVSELREVKSLLRRTEFYRIARRVCEFVGMETFAARFAALQYRYGIRAIRMIPIRVLEKEPNGQDLLWLGYETYHWRD
jgi:hypothetical protein